MLVIGMTLLGNSNGDKNNGGDYDARVYDDGACYCCFDDGMLSERYKYEIIT